MSQKRQEFPGVSHYRDRHSKVRWRYRKGGFTVQLGTDYGCPEFLRIYSAAVKGERLSAGGATAGGSQAPNGSLSAVIQSWYVSPDFTKLGAVTQKNYRSNAERLREEHGTKRVAGLSRPIIKKLMANKAATPGAANNLLRIFHLVLDHAVEMEWIPVNPSRGIKKYSTGGHGFHTWTEEEIDQFYQHHKGTGVPIIAMTLMLYTGAARTDAVQLGRHSLKGNRIQYRRQKMQNRDGVLIDIPLHPRLLKVLLPVKDQGTFLETAEGKPRSGNGLGNSMRAWCDAAGIPQCSSHGLRKACARRLADAGATPHEIMAVTGHKTLAEVQRYTEKVERSALADRAFHKQEDTE